MPYEYNFFYFMNILLSLIKLLKDLKFILKEIIIYGITFIICITLNTKTIQNLPELNPMFHLKSFFFYQK